MSALRCDCCGRFTKKALIVGQWGEGNDQWLECYDCLCVADVETYFKGKTKEEIIKEYENEVANFKSNFIDKL